MGGSPSYCWVVHTRLGAQEASGGLGGRGGGVRLPGSCTFLGAVDGAVELGAGSGSGWNPFLPTMALGSGPTGGAVWESKAWL